MITQTTTRKIDALRRICIPREMVKELALAPHDECEITIEYGCICIRAFDRQNIEARANVGVVRGVDELYRVVIPAEYFNVLMIQPSKSYKVILNGKTIKILK